VLTWSEPFDIAELVRTLDAVLNGLPGRMEQDSLATNEREPNLFLFEDNLPLLLYPTDKPSTP